MWLADETDYPLPCGNGSWKRRGRASRGARSRTLFKRVLEAAKRRSMPTVRSLPDDIEFECNPGESVLEAARRANLPIAHACGGKAKCSTCRVWILKGTESCPPKIRHRARTDRAAGAERRHPPRLPASPDRRCRLSPPGTRRHRFPHRQPAAAARRHQIRRAEGGGAVLFRRRRLHQLLGEADAL